MLLGPNEDDDDKVETSFRIIYLNDEIKNEQQRFKGNSISTAKYNIATFMPKFLLEQFRKAANVFFLFTVICQVSFSTAALRLDVDRICFLVE